MKRIVAALALGAWMLGSLAAAWSAGLGRFTLDVQVFDPDAGCCGFSYDGAVRVDLFDAEQDGASLWSETHASVVIDHGFLSLPLGSVNTVTPLAEVLRAQSGADLYIQVTLGGSGFVFPSRLAVTSVPYALVCSEAANAQTLQGLEPDAFAPDGHTHTVSEIDDFAHDHDARYYTRSQCDAQYATITHNHDHAYLGKTAKAADANLLDGNDSSYFCESASCEDLNTALGTKANTSEVYTKTQLDGGQLDGRYYTESECATLFAPKGTTYSKTEVDNAISQAVTQALDALVDCPRGYTKVTDATIPATGYYCRKAMGEGKYDEMVKVGSFWIDRYEMTIWPNADCTGTQYGTGDGDMHAAGFYRNGMDDPSADSPGLPYKKLYGCSVKGSFLPSRWLTWFQAQQACSFEGKELCSDPQWQAAAYGTPDDSTSCNISTGGPENVGSRTACKSMFGTYDQVGNLWEWTGQWHGGPENNADPALGGDEYHGDGMWNVKAAEYQGGSGTSGNMFPAAALRGGAWSNGAKAGVFALALDYGPSYWSYNIGARCCRR